MASSNTDAVGFQPTSTTPPSATTVVPEEPAPGDLDAVVYEVTGPARAISITYVDVGDVIQTEFNVALPWRKELNLPTNGKDAPSVTVIGSGAAFTCTMTVAGVEVSTNTATGMALCTAGG